MNTRISSWLMLILLSAVTAHITHTTANAQSESCTAPGIQVVVDTNETLSLLQMDVEAVAIAEPYFSDGIARLSVSLKTKKLAPMIAGSWNVFLDTPDGEHRFIQMSTLLGTPQYRYGKVTWLLGLPLFSYEGTVQGVYENDGKIRFLIEKTKLGNPGVGQLMKVSSRTFIKPLLDLLTIDITNESNYLLVGADICAPFRIAQFGASADIPVAADYNRNGTTDFAVWRPETGSWYTVDPATQQLIGVSWGNGALGDIPVVGDFDTDGQADWIIYRPTGGLWYMNLRAEGNIRVTQFGISTDTPTSGDFDGDNISDPTVWRNATGTWYTMLSRTGAVKITNFGLPGDVPAVGDYDGDSIDDVAIWRPSTGIWFVHRSSDARLQGMQFGFGTDRVAHADYDGDGKTDYAVFRPTSAQWYVHRSSSQTMTVYQWGLAEDKVQTGDYDGNGRADYTVWRPSNGTWYVSLN